MGDKYINAMAMIARLKEERQKAEAYCLLNQQYAGSEAEVRVWQMLDAMVLQLEKEPAANVVPCKVPLVPICQNCGKPMAYCGQERIGDMTWERFGCKDCYNQNVCRKVPKGEENHGCSEK